MGKIPILTDLLSRKHLLGKPGNILLTRESVKKLHGFIVDSVLGKIHQDSFEIQGKLVESSRIRREHILHGIALDFGKVSREGLPGWGGREGSCHLVWIWL